MKLDGTDGQLDLIREIAENLPTPVFLVDQTFNVWFHNRAFENAVGVRMSSRRYTGSRCHELLGLETCASDCVMKQVVASGNSLRVASVAGHTVSGTDASFDVTAIPVTSATGNPIGALIVLQDTTAETTIHRKYKELLARNASISFSGAIEHGNLLDILQLFSFLQKTGWLRLECDGQRGEIGYEAGAMVTIRLHTCSGEKAFGRLIRWQEGTFNFSARETLEVSERLDKPSDFILMDAVREKDELAAKAAELPPQDCKPAPLKIADREADSIDDLAWQLYEFCVEGKTVSEMLELSPAADARCYFALLSLRGLGILAW